MTVAEVRTRYLAFFKARGHAIIPSAPIVPGNDPTTLFTSSGMQPLLPYFLGKDHPEGKRVVDSQLSFRAGDIEEVGDNRHTTFFEMLGNWSFGDYFKKEQIEWFWEFLIDELKLDPKRIFVTCYIGNPEAGIPKDTESAAVWKKLFSKAGIEAKEIEIGDEARGYELGEQDGRIFFYADKNWWSRAGAPGKMPEGEPGGPDTEMFYMFPDVQHDTRWGPLCHPNCDCGRYIELGNSVFMQYLKTSSGFDSLPKQNVDYGGGLERITAATNDSPDVFLIDVFSSARKFLEQKAGTIYGTDEQKTKAMRIVLDHMRAGSFMLAEGVTPSNTEAGYVLRRLIRRAIREVDRLGIKDPVLADIAEGYGEVYADAYPHVKSASAKIREELTKEEEQFRKTLSNGLKEFEKYAGEGNLSGVLAYLLFSSYGFPFELTLELAKERGLLVTEHEVETFTALFNSKMKEHQDTSRAGGAQRFAGGLADHAEQTVRYHTTHHILLKALQMVLGKEVHQRGSNITSERLRIDFASPAKMTDEQKAEVEKIVNELIYQDLPVTRTVMPREEAEKLGAEMEFGVKYPDMVSVYSVGPAGATETNPNIPEAFSLEFCGGPHVTNTSEIHEGGKKFKIKKEEAVASGVRRIKAVLE